MKKALSLLLALLMIVPALVVPTTAATVSESGVKANNCCEIIASQFSDVAHYSAGTTGTNFQVGMLDGYQAVSFTTVGATGGEQWGGDGASFKIPYSRVSDTTLPASEDISNMTHLVFDLYISDASKLVDRQRVWIELSSSGTSDHEEAATAQPLEDIVGKTLVSGWNHVEIPLTTFSTLSGVFDKTAWDFFRFYNDGAFPANITLGLANMYFINANCEEHYSHATYQFSVLDKQSGYNTEATYRVPELSNTSVSSNTFRFMDSAAAQIYRFDNIDGDRISHATFKGYMGAQLQVSVSKSANGPWATAYQYQTTAMNSLAAEGMIDAVDQVFLWKDADGTAAWFHGSNTSRGAAASDEFIAKYESITGKKDLTTYIAAGSAEGFDASTASYTGRQCHPGGTSSLSPLWLTIDLTEAIKTLPGDSNQLYVKISDSYPASGWGGSIQNVATLSVRYDESIPAYVENTVEYSFDVLRASEGAYLYDDKSNVAQDGSRNNYSRYCDQGAYFTYRYPLGNVQNADALYWTLAARGQISVKVSTDNQTWVEAYAHASENNLLSGATRAYDLLSALKSDKNTATSADYLYVRIGDAVTSNGNGGGITSYTNVKLSALVNENVDVRAYEDNSFLLFTQGEQDYIVSDCSYGQARTNGSYQPYLNNGVVDTSKLSAISGGYKTKWTAASGEVTSSADRATMKPSVMMDETLKGNVNNANKYTLKYNDGNRYIIYGYQLSVDNILRADHLTFNAFMGNKIRILVSTDNGKTWPYTLHFESDTNYDEHYVKVDLLTVEGLKDAIIANGGAFQLIVRNTDDTSGYGAKIVGYDNSKTVETLVTTDTANNVQVYKYDTYPGKPYAVSMTLEYDANTAGQLHGTVVNEYNYVGEPIYTANTGSDKGTYPYLVKMPVDPNEPLYTGKDASGRQLSTGRMSDQIKKKVNTATQVDGVYDGNWNGRFHDANYFIYYYPIAGLDTSRAMTLSLPIGGQYGIKVAVGSDVCPTVITTHNDETNGNTWGGDDWVFLTDYIAEGGSGNGSGGVMKTFTIDPAIFGESIDSATHIYFMFYDAVTPGGYGARIGLGMYQNGKPVLPTTFTYHTVKDVTGIRSASLNLTEDFNMLYTTSPEATDVAPIYTFALGESTGVLVNSSYNEKTALWGANFENIMPYRMAETITAKAYTKVNGIVYTTEQTYSVKQYCINMLAKSTDAKLTALLNAILAYGDAAQTYVNYQTDALASTGVAGFVAPGTTYAAGTYENHRALSGTASVASWKSARLLLGAETSILATFKAEDVADLSVVVDGKAVAYEALGDGLYSVTIPVNADKFNEKLTFNFAVGGVTDESYTLTYSVGSYFETMYASASDATRAMLDALANYGLAVDAYLAN